MAQLAPEDLDPARWVDEHGDYLYNYAQSRVGEKALAEDLVQDTFLSAIKAVGKFGGKSSIRTWLTSILRNKIMDHFRKSWRSQSMTQLAEFYEKEESDLFGDNGHWRADTQGAPADWQPEQLEATDRVEFWQFFNQCSGKLPDRIRSIYLLREVDGEDTEVILEASGISKANFWTIMHRARMAMRKCLEDNWLGATGKL